MPAAEHIVERFPTWSNRARHLAAPRFDWVSLGSEYDIAHLVRLWQLVMQFRIEDLPDDDSVMWQLADALRGRRSGIVLIREAEVFVERRHLKDFRDAVDWLWEHLADEHGVQRYRWSRDVGNYVRIESERQPITALEDARKAIAIIKILDDILADTVVKIWEDV
jgi:hypothetical protein